MRTTVSVAVDDSLCGVTDSGHNITMDMSPDVGCGNQGPLPMYMLLLGRGGCTLIDVMLILRKSRQEFSALRVELEAARADDIPKVFTRIHAHFVVSGDNLDSKKVSRASRLSADKYCSAAKMLGAGAQITHDFEICPD